MKDACYWIEKLELARHPEGGYFRETYRSDEVVSAAGLPARFGAPRAFSTAIYFLLPGNECSAFHRIKSDELWHFYAGSGLTIHIIEPNGTYTHLGLDGEHFQALVRADWWFGATVDDPQSFSLVGCTVAPGFDFADFELAGRDAIIELFPQHRAIIERLTR